MVILFHDSNVITSIEVNGKIVEGVNEKIHLALVDLAVQHPDEVIAWCHERVRDRINRAEFNIDVNYPFWMISCSPIGQGYFGKLIGYVDQSTSIKINQNVTYPTWQMSSLVGAISSNTLNSLVIGREFKGSFDYFLNALGKQLKSQGVLCYRKPALLFKEITDKFTQSSISQLMSFVRHYYGIRWLGFLMFNLLFFEKKIDFGAIKALTSRVKKVVKQSQFNWSLTYDSIANESFSVDVIIPTLGRKKYLCDFLADLTVQTHLPNKVIIVEQDSSGKGLTELDDLKNQDWPFVLDIIFTQQLGACHARNIALSKVAGDYVFFADDDIRVSKGFIADALNHIVKLNLNAASLQCRQPNEKSTKLKFGQWGGFGSGSSIVNLSALKGLKFDTNYEHGFGEDSDFGMQLRNSGTDIFYLPKPEILHLKAPSGGFRTKFKQPWDVDSIKTKPSPTVLLFFKKHCTREQLLGYKVILFLKFYRVQPIWNPLTYYRIFKRQWQLSNYWAENLLKK